MKILIVDDIQDYVEMIESLLLDDWENLKAYSLQEAQEKLKTVKVDIALVDVRLNENDDQNKDGILLLKWIKENYPDTKVIMMSAYKEFEYAVEALNLGAEYFLKKPLKPDEVMKVLEKVKK